MQITPTSYVQLPLTQLVDQLEIIVNPFSLFPSEITILWTVSGNGISKEGTMILPQSVIDQWGVDDTIVKDYVLQQLNLTEETTPEPTNPAPSAIDGPDPIVPDPIAPDPETPEIV